MAPATLMARTTIMRWSGWMRTWPLAPRWPSIWAERCPPVALRRHDQSVPDPPAQAAHAETPARPRAAGRAERPGHRRARAGAGASVGASVRAGGGGGLLLRRRDDAAGDRGSARMLA